MTHRTLVEHWFEHLYTPRGPALIEEMVDSPGAGHHGGRGCAAAVRPRGNVERMDKATLVVAATLALGALAETAACGGATTSPRATRTPDTAQVIDGNASCGVASDDEAHAPQHGPAH